MPVGILFPLLVNRWLCVNVVFQVVPGDVLSASHSTAVSQACGVGYIDFDQAVGRKLALHFQHRRKVGMGEMFEGLAAADRIEKAFLKRQGSASMLHTLNTMECI